LMDLFEFFTTVFSNLLGASIGAFLGYRFAVRREREFRDEQALDLKLKFLNSVLEEIEYNYNRFKRASANRWDYNQPVNIIFKTFTFEGGVHSGKFDILSHDLQVAITAFYLLCTKANNLLMEYESSEDPARMARIERQRASIEENMERVMPEVTKYLNVEKEALTRLQMVNNNHIMPQRPNLA